MTDFTWFLSYSVLLSETVLGGAGLVLTRVFSDLEERRFYRVLLPLLSLSSAYELVLLLAKLGPGAAWHPRYEGIFRELLHLFLFPAFTAFLLSCCGEKPRGSLALYLMIAARLFILAEAVVFAALGYSVTATRETMGDYIPQIIVSAVCAVFALAVDFVILLRRWKKLTGRQRLLFAAFFFFYNSVVILLLELLILRDQNQRYLAQKEELDRQRAELLRQRTKVAVLQMRPHFIQNTLIGIYYLCQSDISKVPQVVLDFSNYLRANFFAVVSEECIPFDKELEHTRAYLSVVQAMYEGRLFVEYDTQTTAFSLPPLTLQPIVENAAKYGISPELDPLYISIITEAEEGGVRLTVEDTGPSFDPSDSPDDGEPHFALKNIRERLEMLCGGTLEIAAREEGGTRVTIRVPRQQTESE